MMTSAFMDQQAASLDTWETRALYRDPLQTLSPPIKKLCQRLDDRSIGGELN